MPSNLFLFIIVLFACTVESLAGFGKTVISLTLGVHLMPIEVLLPVLVPLNVLLSTYFVLQYYRQVDYRFLLRQILPFMSIGLGLGIVCFNLLAGSEWPKKLLGVLVVLFSARQLYELSRQIQMKPMPPWQAAGLILLSGVTHGLYASGGPLLVFTLSHQSIDKTTLRSTLAMVWLILNLVLVGSYVSTSKITLQTLQTSLILLPTLPIDIWLGEWLHRRVDERQFKQLVFGLLILAGSSLVLK